MFQLIGYLILLALTCHAEEPATGKTQSARIRALLKRNEVLKAAEAADLAVSLLPKDADVLAALGDVQFRRGGFDAAEITYLKAFQLDHQCGRCLLGLGRLRVTESRFKTAVQLFEKAHAADPGDPDIAYRWAAAQKREDQIAAIEEFLAAPDLRESDETTGARIRLAILRAIGTQHTRVLEGERKPGVVALELMTDLYGHEHGLGIKVSLNGGKPERLILDTGAGGMLLDRKTAMKAGVKILTQSKVEGIGDEGPKKAAIGLLDTVQIGDYRFKNCVVELFDNKLSNVGKAGLIGANWFSQFLVTIDYKSRALRLKPNLPPGIDVDADYDREIPAGEEEFTRFRRFGHNLLVAGSINRARSGWFIIDTGAYQNLLSKNFVQGLVRVDDRDVPHVAGISGTVSDTQLARAMTLEFGRIRQQNGWAISFDFGKISDSTGAEISGLIGRPALQHLVTTIDYRNGLVNFLPAK